MEKLAQADVQRRRERGTGEGGSRVQEAGPPSAPHTHPVTPAGLRGHVQAAQSGLNAKGPSPSVVQEPLNLYA